MKYLIDKNNFKGNVLSTVTDNGYVNYSGSLYNNGGENLLLDDYLKVKELQNENINAELVNDEQLDELLKAWHSSICGQWVEIAEEKYWDSLECLPPMQWHDINSRYNVFFCMEAQTSHIHSMYIKDKTKEKYYTCLFSRFSSDADILKAIENMKIIKSEECKNVLQLMDKNYSYSEALTKVLEADKTINKEQLEKELNQYI